MKLMGSGFTVGSPAQVEESLGWWSWVTAEMFTARLKPLVDLLESDVSSYSQKRGRNRYIHLSCGPSQSLEVFPGSWRPSSPQSWALQATSEETPAQPSHSREPDQWSASPFPCLARNSREIRSVRGSPKVVVLVVVQKPCKLELREGSWKSAGKEDNREHKRSPAGQPVMDDDR